MNQSSQIEEEESQSEFQITLNNAYSNLLSNHYLLRSIETQNTNYLQDKGWQRQQQQQILSNEKQHHLYELIRNFINKGENFLKKKNSQKQKQKVSAINSIAKKQIQKKDL